jgi:uncharacterized protein YkwD
MARLALAAAVALLATAFAACGDDPAAEDPSSAATAGSGTWTLLYADTRHPVVSDTADPAVLARESEVEALVNHYRVARGLPALESLPEVRGVSRAHSEHMIAHDFFGHRNPEADEPGDRASRASVPFARYGENIAAGYTTPQSVFNAWLASAGHRANIEDSTWTHHGVGYAYAPADSAFYYDYWTHNFLRR